MLQSQRQSAARVPHRCDLSLLAGRLLQLSSRLSKGLRAQSLWHNDVSSSRSLQYARMRVTVMLRHSPENYTVIVRELPTQNEAEQPFTDADLFALFDFMVCRLASCALVAADICADLCARQFPGEVVSARVAPHLPQTEKLRAQRQQAARNLERAAATIGIDFYGESIGDYKAPKKNVRLTQRLFVAQRRSRSRRSASWSKSTRSSAASAARRCAPFAVCLSRHVLTSSSTD